MNFSFYFFSYSYKWFINICPNRNIKNEFDENLTSPVMNLFTHHHNIIQQTFIEAARLLIQSSYCRINETITKINRGVSSINNSKR